MSKSAKKSDIDVWMPLFIGDYLADTSRLTTEQHGAYLLLIMDYWRSGSPPDDDAVLAQITRASAPGWKKLRSTLAGYFSIEDGKWIHPRIEEELAAARARAEKAHVKGKKGAAARWGNEPMPEHIDGQSPEDATSNAPSNASGNATSIVQAMPKQCPSPSPSQNIKTLKPLSGRPDEIPPGFAEFWSTWPRGQRKESKAECLKRWRAKGLEAESAGIIASVVAKKKTKKWLEGYEPAPLTFLNQRQWLDDPADTEAEGVVSHGEGDPEAWRADPRFKGGK